MLGVLQEDQLEPGRSRKFCHQDKLKIRWHSHRVCFLSLPWKISPLPLVADVFLLKLLLCREKFGNLERWFKMSNDTVFSDNFPLVYIPLSAAVGIIFSIFLWVRVSKVLVTSERGSGAENGHADYLLEEGQPGEEEVGAAKSISNMQWGCGCLGQLK